jgi:hypothetical protein
VAAGSLQPIALKRWTIILTIGQHCHFLIFRFEMDSQENGEEEDPCMKILLKEMKSWEMIKMQTTIRIWATPFPFKIRRIQAHMRSPSVGGSIWRWQCGLFCFYLRRDFGLVCIDVL